MSEFAARSRAENYTTLEHICQEKLFDKSFDRKCRKVIHTFLILSRKFFRQEMSKSHSQIFKFVNGKKR